MIILTGADIVTVHKSFGVQKQSPLGIHRKQFTGVRVQPTARVGHLSPCILHNNEKPDTGYLSPASKKSHFGELYFSLPFLLTTRSLKIIFCNF